MNIRAEGNGKFMMKEAKDAVEIGMEVIYGYGRWEGRIQCEYHWWILDIKKFIAGLSKIKGDQRGNLLRSVPFLMSRFWISKFFKLYVRHFSTQFPKIDAQRWSVNYVYRSSLGINFWELCWKMTHVKFEIFLKVWRCLPFLFHSRSSLAVSWPSIKALTADKGFIHPTVSSSDSVRKAMARISIEATLFVLCRRYSCC